MPCKRPSFPRLPLDSLLDVRLKPGALMSVKSADYVLREHGMKAGSILMAMWLAAASLSAGAAQLYQWKDAQGRTVYSDQPPPPSIKNAQQKAFKGTVIEIGESYDAKTPREKYPVPREGSASQPRSSGRTEKAHRPPERACARRRQRANRRVRSRAVAGRARSRGLSQGAFGRQAGDCRRTGTRTDVTARTCRTPSLSLLASRASPPWRLPYRTPIHYGLKPMKDRMRYTRRYENSRLECQLPQGPPAPVAGLYRHPPARRGVSAGNQAHRRCLPRRRPRRGGLSRRVFRTKDLQWRRHSQPHRTGRHADRYSRVRRRTKARDRSHGRRRPPGVRVLPQRPKPRFRQISLQTRLVRCTGRLAEG